MDENNIPSNLELKNLNETDKTLRHLWMQYLVGIILTTIAFLQGAMDGWTSSTLPKLRDGRGPYHLSNSQTSWAASIGNIGSVFSAYFIGLAMQHIGRKIVLLSYVPLFLLALIILYFATNSIYLYTSQLIIGAIEPIKYSVVPFYLGEVTYKTVRGRLAVVNTFSGKIGEIISLIISAQLGYKGYIAILIAFTIVSFFCLIFIPRSPYFKLRQGDQSGALQNYKFLNRGIGDIQLYQELEILEKEVKEEMQNKSSYSELIRNPVTRKAVIILLGLKTILFATGAIAIHQYLQIILEQTNSTISPNTTAIFCCILQAFGIFISYFLIDKIGRKPLLFISYTSSAISLFVCGSYFFISKFYNNFVINITWIPLVAIISFEFIDLIGNQISTVLTGELFTINIKEHVLVVDTIYVGIINFCVTKLFGVISADVGLYLTFWICCFCMILGIIFTRFVVVETKGKSLVEIQDIFYKTEILKK